MALKSFEQTISSAYETFDRKVKALKSSFIGICSDVDRTFRLLFGINIYEPVDEESFNRIKVRFRNFEKLTVQQFNSLLQLFVDIRDLNAHLFLKKNIHIDDEIVSFISQIITPKYVLAINGEITIYGAICVLLLFTMGYQFWTLIREIVRYDVFREIKKEGINEYQRQFMNDHKSLLGQGKPIYPENIMFFDKKDIVFFIEVVKQTMTLLIFDLEEASIKKPKMFNNALRTKEYLRRYECLNNNEELIQNIVELRNLWLHGYRLFDKVNLNDKEFIFDLDYVFEIMSKIKQAFSNTRYSIIIDIINELGNQMIDFYTKRSIEISCKLIDKSLSKEEKVIERINNSLNAYTHAMMPEEWFYDKTISLLEGDKKWYMARAKFEDNTVRVLKEKRLSVFEFTSSNGFFIGETHYDANEMVLTDVVCPTNSQLKINGKYLEEYKTNINSTYGIMDIYEIDF